MNKVKMNVLTAALLVMSSAAQAQTYVSCDFENGIPSGFELIDEDGLTPSADMQKLGFAVGTPWICMEESKTSANRVAASTSYYKPAGTSRDWMITPAFMIDHDNAVLQWRARAYDKKYADGYEVRLLTGEGTTQYDVLFATDGENSDWQQHETSLQPWLGQTVRVAFVNTSTDKSRLYIDDIFAGVNARVFVESHVPTMLDYAGQVAVTGRVYTKQQEPADEVTIGLVVDGKEYVETFADGEWQMVNGQWQMPFSLSHALTIGNNQTLDYTLWVEAEGQRNTIACHTSAYAHKVVAEEGTGTWCSWCVRGIVRMKEMNERHPEHFIGIAVHNKDVMRYPDYDSFLGRSFGITSYPNLIVGRRTDCQGDPLNLELFYNKALATPYHAGIALEADLDAATATITARAQLMFADDWDDAAFRLSYVLIENDVHGDNKNYNQGNAYADGTAGAMGGFENLPNPVPYTDMYYQEVARYVHGPFEGIEGSVPQVLRAGQAVEHEASFAMPAEVLVAENCEVVCLLLNADGTIANAEKCHLQTKSGATGIDGIEDSSLNIGDSSQKEGTDPSMFNGQSSMFNGQSSMSNGQSSMFNGQWSIYDITGRRLAKAPAKGLTVQKRGSRYVKVMVR